MPDERMVEVRLRVSESLARDMATDPKTRAFVARNLGEDAAAAVVARVTEEEADDA